MSDPKDWKIGDIVRPRMYCPEYGVDDVEYSIACGPLNGMFMFRSRGLPVWRSPHQLIFVRTAEAERERIAPAPVSLRTMKTDVFPITHDEFTVTFPPTAKTVNVSVHPETKCSVNGTVVQEGLESPKDAKPHPFYVGQRLICVDDSSCSSITNGKEYYVTGCGDDFVRLNGLIGSWSGWRFKPAPFKVGDKVKAIKPLPCEDIKDFTVTSVADSRHGGQWLRFDGKCSGEPCGSFQLVTPAPEKPEPRFKPGDRVCCVKQIDITGYGPVVQLKVDHVNKGGSFTVKASVVSAGQDIVSFEELANISFDAKNFRKVDSLMVGDYVKCVSIPSKSINPDYADFKVGEVALVTGVSNVGWIRLQGKSRPYYDPARFAKCEAPKAPQPAPFRVGDVVTCVDASLIGRDELDQLVKGGDYVVTSVEPVDGSRVTVKASGSTYAACGSNWWYSHRFVHKVIKKPAQVTFCGVDMGTAGVDSSPKWYDMGNRREYRDAFVAAFEKAMKNLSCRWEMIQVPAKPPEPEKPEPFKVGDVVICVEKSDWDCRSMAKPGDIRKVIRVTDDNCLEFVVGQSPNSASRFKLYEPKFSPMDLVECIEGCSDIPTGAISEVVRSGATHVKLANSPVIGFPSNHFKIHKTADQRMNEVVRARGDQVHVVREKMAEAAKRPCGHLLGHPDQTIGYQRDDSLKIYPTSPQAYLALSVAGAQVPVLHT